MLMYDNDVINEIIYLSGLEVGSVPWVWVLCSMGILLVLTSAERGIPVLVLKV